MDYLKSLVLKAVVHNNVKYFNVQTCFSTTQGQLFDSLV